MFSVVIPLYNKEVSIFKTTMSVLNQINQNFEIIIVDDGSTDNSVERLKEIQDPRLRIIQQENQGVSAARNRGIREAKYEWIALLDGDDLWRENHLSEIENLIEQNPHIKVFGTSFDYSDNRVVIAPSDKQNSYIINNYFKEALRYPVLWTSITVINRSCFNRVGYFCEKLSHGEDIDMWVRLGKHYSIAKSLKKTATYKVDAENRSGLCKDIDKLHVYHFDLESCAGKEEENYYRNLIHNHMLQYLLSRSYLNFHKLKKRHNQITYISFIKHSFNILGPSVSKKILSVRNKPYKK